MYVKQNIILSDLAQGKTSKRTLPRSTIARVSVKREERDISRCFTTYYLGLNLTYYSKDLIQQ